MSDSSQDSRMISSGSPGVFGNPMEGSMASIHKQGDLKPKRVAEMHAGGKPKQNSGNPQMDAMSSQLRQNLQATQEAENKSAEMKDKADGFEEVCRRLAAQRKQK